MNEKELQNDFIHNKKYIKQLAGDYDFIDTGYRILISEKASIYQKKRGLWEWLRGYFNEFFK